MKIDEERLFDFTLLSILAFIFSSLPYLLRGYLSSPYGFDTIVYVYDFNLIDRYGFQYLIDNPISVKNGYILIGYLLHKLLGLSFMDLEKIIPAVISAFIPLIFYWIAYIYTENRAYSFLSGFLSVIFFGRYWLVRENHGQLLAFVLLAASFAFMIKTMKEASEKSHSQKRAFISYLKKKRTLVTMFLLFYAGYSSEGLFVLYMGVVILFILALFVRNLFRRVHTWGEIKNNAFKMMIQIAIPVTLVSLLILNVHMGSFSLIYKAGRDPIDPHLYVSSFYNMIVQKSFPTYLSYSFYMTFPWIGELTILNAPTSEGPHFILFENLNFLISILLSFFTFVGVLFTFHRGFIRSSRDMDRFAFLFLWFIVPFTISLLPYFDIYVNAFRILIVAPFPLLTSIGFAFIMTSLCTCVRAHKITFKLRKETSYFSWIQINDRFIKLSASVLLILILIPPTLNAANYSIHSRDFFNEALIEQLEYLKSWREKFRPGSIAVFVIESIPMVESTLIDKTYLVESIMREECLFYFGKLEFYLMGEYTPNLDPKINEKTFMLWKLFGQGLEQYRCYDIETYVLSSLYTITEDEKRWIDFTNIGKDICIIGQLPPFEAFIEGFESYPDKSNGSPTWNAVSGRWTVEDGEYCQKDDEILGARTFTGNLSWIDYSVEANVYAASTEEIDPLIVADEKQSSFWIPLAGGKGSLDIALIDDSQVKVKGNDSLQIIVGSGPYEWWNIKHIYDTTQDWMLKDHISLYWYGEGTNVILNLYVMAPDDFNVFRSVFKDDFRGWRKLIFPLKEFSIFKGSPTWSKVGEIRIEEVSNVRGTWRLDRLILDISPHKPKPYLYYHSAGIIFRAVSNTNFYVFQIDFQDQEAQLLKVNGVDPEGKGISIMSSKPIAVDLHNWYKLKVVVDGFNITGYIDGEEVVSCNDFSYANGPVGLWTWNTYAHFDDVQIQPLHHEE